MLRLRKPCVFWRSENPRQTFGKPCRSKHAARAAPARHCPCCPDLQLHLMQMLKGNMLVAVLCAFAIFQGVCCSAPAPTPAEADGFLSSAASSATQVSLITTLFVALQWPLARSLCFLSRLCNHLFSLCQLGEDTPNLLSETEAAAGLCAAQRVLHSNLCCFHPFNL